MAEITTFGDLKGELTGYMFHSRFAARYEHATQMFERVASRRLRTKWQERFQNITTQFGIGDVPTDYATWRTLLWKKQWIELDYVHPAYFRTNPNIDADSTGNPEIFSLENQTLYIAPQDNTPAAFEFHYYCKVLTITDGPQGSNWLLLRWPDVYLNGVLFELFKLQRNLEAAQMYKQLRDEIFAEIIQSSALETAAPSSKVRGAGSALGSGGEYF